MAAAAASTCVSLAANVKLSASLASRAGQELVGQQQEQSGSRPGLAARSFRSEFLGAAGSSSDECADDSAACRVLAPAAGTVSSPSRGGRCGGGTGYGGSQRVEWQPSLRRRNGLAKSIGYGGRGSSSRARVSCGIMDFLGADLLRFDVGRWKRDLDTHGALAVYCPLEGGSEGRYACGLKDDGWNFMNISARGLGDPEAYLSKIHAVTPVLSKAELQYLVLLPALRPNVRVVAEMGGYRQFRWKPLKDVVGLPPLKELPDSTTATGSTSASSIETAIVPSGEKLEV
ncbi:hypothetical protein CBR_g36846 [Chara braunii]|uniref:Uncharacterized protein n=1 Tax=Chara braunii TaxID=69332 RepID=A0A388LLU5_CHABU|nr:hypothetical protein CBR_g36846 [Chara braunii]|eukprot:GBG83231.1 hypothetical protein CBR_g36846 [Chara braunii]